MERREAEICGGFGVAVLDLILLAAPKSSDKTTIYETKDI
jgi:hypothetical protein